VTLPKPDWRMLRRRMTRVKIESCADGTLRVTPVWRRGYAFGPHKIPGVFTRMGVAGELERMLNARLKGRR
jgi:hypothetical protein